MARKKNSIALLLFFSFALLIGLMLIPLLIPIPIWLVIIITLIIAALLTVNIIRILHQQFKQISQTAVQITKGDHSLRIPDLGTKEFYALGKDLNSMLEKLDKTIYHLAVHREELRLVLSSIDDILWSQSSEGKLEWTNEPFQKLFGNIGKKDNVFYPEIFRDPYLLSFIKDCESGKDKLRKEIVMDGHHYLLSGSHNDQAKRCIFILQNIDEIKQAEQMKKDFIVNLAHELRTPLTAISGFAEAMEDNINETNLRYLKIIQNHTQRLIHLISDLEQLIRLERTAAIELQVINLSTFFDNIAFILSPMVEEKGLYLKIELDENLPTLTCDPFKLEQVFINLVQNSLRYTITGGITIRSQKLNNEALFEVCDTGTGIDKVHLPRIFERFYVADPARNKTQSGTGLGLAIVKHIVQLHQGSITVQSEPGKGSVFSVSLPLLQASETH
ncbi:MAG: Alkaline phosphatase synthesis sensor protein PhoR [Candidatus Cloacimonetes bacterium ADurb.Bin089]|nr:MAG: Alkaline phosphatase synthesis sensor protein PhoR [Candidatus Cloacimonetes bacterium ADurb.Bin089]